MPFIRDEQGRLIRKDGSLVERPARGWGKRRAEGVAPQGRRDARRILDMPDRLIAHATRKEQLAEVGLDPAGIARSVRDAVRAAVTADERVPL